MTTDALAPPRRDSYIRSAILRALLVSICLVGVSTGQPLAASERTAPPAAEVEAETEYARASVTLDGEVLFSVRGVQAYPAEKRAEVIGGRIKALAADPSVSVEALRLAETERGTDILAGDRLDLFNEYGVQIMTPAYEGDPQQPKLVPKEQWFAAPARRR